MKRHAHTTRLLLLVACASSLLLFTLVHAKEAANAKKIDEIIEFHYQKYLNSLPESQRRYVSHSKNSLVPNNTHDCAHDAIADKHFGKLYVALDKLIEEKPEEVSRYV